MSVNTKMTLAFLQWVWYILNIQRCNSKLPQSLGLISGCISKCHMPSVQHIGQCIPEMIHSLHFIFDSVVITDTVVWSHILLMERNNSATTVTTKIANNCTSQQVLFHHLQTSLTVNVPIISHAPFCSPSFYSHRLSVLVYLAPSQPRHRLQ